MIEEMLAYNKKFVEEKRYEQYAASKYPNRKGRDSDLHGIHGSLNCSRQRLVSKTEM